MNWRGLAWRAHNPRWSWAPLSGEGAATHGGRFNAKGTPALYLSLDHNTALLEASQGFALKFQPLTLVTYEVDCADIVDLTSARERTAWGTSEAEIGCAWKLLAESGQDVPTWQIAARLMAGGQAGAILRSFAPGATAANRNLVLWSWGGTPPHRIAIVDSEGRLPRNDRSWRDR